MAMRRILRALWRRASVVDRLAVLLIVLFVIVVGAFYVNTANWHPFAPFGFTGLSFFGKTVLGQSDAGAHLIYDAGFGYATRLLGYWIREKQIMTLEEGVRKLTFMVASIFGLRDRGLLRRGMAADLCVFDPATIRECDPEMVQDLPGNEKCTVMIRLSHLHPQPGLLQ